MSRTTDLTPEIEALLVASLQNGLSKTHACLQAGISRQTFYNWCEDEEFLDKMDMAEQFGLQKARQNIQKAVNDGNLSISQWLLERRDQAFKPKSDVTTDDMPIPLSLVEFIGDDPADTQDKSTDT